MEPDYLQAALSEGQAQIAVGWTLRGRFLARTTWHVEPEWMYRPSSDAGAPVQQEKPGFRVREVSRGRKDHGTRTFPDEQAVAEYLLTKIAEGMARQTHRAEQRRGSR